MNTANEITGSKYVTTRDLDVAAIAKLIRADIKAAAIPAGTKCSVSISRFSGGCSIRVSVTACPVQIWTDAYLASDPNSYFEGDRRTDEAQELLATLNEIVQAYNRDSSDSQTDYFNKRFYSSVDFSTDVTRADRVRSAARLSA